MKNRERKIWWKMSFSTIWLRKENREESFPFRPFFFILPIWKENGKGKMLRNTFYTNILSPTPHSIHDLMTFASSQYRCLGLCFFFLGNVASFFFSFDFLGCLLLGRNVAPLLFIYFSGSKVAFSFFSFFPFFFFWFSMGWAWVFFFF